ncbi:MAG: Vitamin K epoxide reductase [Chloroflexi bacterium OLB14]|nr:MAG: Vitamin K epoxide reductase [Chloroflexi bacterium OLB14]
MDKWLNRVLYLALIVGLGVGIYMSIFKATGNEAMCLGNGDCAIVTESRFSKINGIAVPHIGLIGNIALLAVLFFESKNSFLRKNGTLLFFALALGGFLFTLWLIYLEIFILQAFCPFCITAQTCMVIVFALAVTRLIKNPNL